MGEKFFHAAGWNDVASWDHASIIETLRGMLANPQAILLVIEHTGILRGMLGGLVYPHYFNAKQLAGQEVFLWVDPEYRFGLGSQLMQRAEQAARDLGAVSWSMISLAEIRPEATARLYQRRGYRAAESVFIKAL